MGYFFDRESAEISQFDDLRLGRIEFCKTVESFVDRDGCIIQLRDKQGALSKLITTEWPPRVLERRVRAAIGHVQLAVGTELQASRPVQTSGVNSSLWR